MDMERIYKLIDSAVEDLFTSLKEEGRLHELYEMFEIDYTKTTNQRP